MLNYIRQIFEYDNWANKEITDSILRIDSAPGKGMSLMSHIFNAQIVWLSRIKQTEPTAGVWQEYDRQEIQKIQKQISSELSDFINSLNESDLSKTINYKNSKGEEFQSKLSDILIHLTHHSAYHRGQVILLIKDSLNSVPYTDYIHFVRNVKKQP